MFHRTETFSIKGYELNIIQIALQRTFKTEYHKLILIEYIVTLRCTKSHLSIFRFENIVDIKFKTSFRSEE